MLRKRLISNIELMHLQHATLCPFHGHVDDSGNLGLQRLRVADRASDETAQHHDDLIPIPCQNNCTL